MDDAIAQLEVEDLVAGDNASLEIEELPQGCR